MRAKALPHGYEVSLAGNGELATLRGGARPPIVGELPSELGGSDDCWSPEHLLVGATSLCFYEGFRSLARQRGLAILAYECAARGTLDRTTAGIAFTRIRLLPKLLVHAGAEALAHELLDTAKRHCIIANSLTCLVEVEETVSVRATVGAA